MGSETMTPLMQALANVVRLGLDSNPIIYYIELNPKYDGLVTPLFDEIEQGRFEVVTSVLTLTEVLTYPLAINDTAIADDYRELLLASEYFTTVTVTPPIAELAVELRARHRIRTPDAIQLATAISEECEAFLTNDRDLRRVTEISVLILDDLTL